MNYCQEEFKKRDKELVLIASENYPSQKILDASGSIFQLKYSEGFVNSRYYCGCEIVDKMEQECIDKCLELFNAENSYLANVQPNSGASANMIVYNAVLQPGDVVLAPSVKGGGHISHSHPKSFIAKYHKVIEYDVDENGFLNYDEIEKLAVENQPTLIICGASNYSREIDFERFKAIADKVNAKLMADIAHISILVAHGLHKSPVGLADFITSTTHKCLKGPRGAFIIYKKEYDKQIRLSTIPGLFGGPLQHQIYAKLICFREALTMLSKGYSAQILKNAKSLCRGFLDRDIPIVTGGTDNHLMTVDLRDYIVTGKQIADILSKCGIICNCNTVPRDPRSFLQTSGIRLGTPAVTARGLDEAECYHLGISIANVINRYKKEGLSSASEIEVLKNAVRCLTNRHPLSSIYVL